jgi:hypothetical protein
MRTVPALTFLLLFAVAGFAQDAPGLTKPTPWENSTYRVKAVVPAGWSVTRKEPKSRARWVELSEFSESRSGATLTVAVQTSAYRSADEMISKQRDLFQKDSRLAVLRDEVRAASDNRPKGVLFEYTFQSSGKTRHAVAVYWQHRDRRYRVYATVRDAAWKTVAEDIRSFVDSVEFSFRAFARDPQNYTDEVKNFRMYFPEGWTIKLPASGPRVVFTSVRQGVSVWVHADSVTRGLEAEVRSLRNRLEDDGAKKLEVGSPRKNIHVGERMVQIDYVKTREGTDYRYREQVFVYAGVLYRVVLAGAVENGFERGVSDYDRMVDSVAFIRS